MGSRTKVFGFAFLVTDVFLVPKLCSDPKDSPKGIPLGLRKRIPSQSDPFGIGIWERDDTLRTFYKDKKGEWCAASPFFDCIFFITQFTPKKYLFVQRF